LIAGEWIEEVEGFKYLGGIVSKKGGTSKKARQAFAMLKPMWRITALTARTMLRDFGSNVRAVLLCGSETWRLTKELKQKFREVAAVHLRTILRIWWPRRIFN